MLRDKIVDVFRETLLENQVPPPEPLSDDTVLLSSGLDSLGFAILVTKLEMQLGYDPFTLMKEPFYPSTLKEFVDLYEQYAGHANT